MRDALMNVWQMAGWSEEIGEALLSRRISGKLLLLYRTADGSAVAMADRCPHRFAPLSLGERRGDDVVCGYHGLRFGPAGKCVHNPYSDRIPAAATVETYPLVERDGVAWVWLGEPTRADPALIADFSFLPDSPTNRTIYGYTLLEANFEYGTDNLMDLSHIEFVHKGSFAGNGVIFAGQHAVVQEGETLHSNWWMPDVAAPPHTAGIYPPDLRTDHWLDMRWNAPATMHLRVGATPHQRPREEGLVVHQAHILTPETEGTAHYFWASTRSNNLDSPDMDAMLKQLFAQAFDAEDKPMIKAAYDNVEGGDFWEQKPVFLGIDAGGTRARRMLERMRAAEAAAVDQSSQAAE